MTIAPDIVLAGFAKCATSSLAEQLVRMPEIDYHIPNQKEPKTYIFRRRQCFTSAAVSTYQQKRHNEGKLLLDASTAYAVFPEGLTRIAKVNPNATVVFILRDPIERMKSHLNWIQKVEPLAIPLQLQLKIAPKKSYFSRRGNSTHFMKTSALYAGTILHAKQLFKSVHLIYFDDFTQDQHATLQELRSTLGLSKAPQLITPLQENKTASTQYKKKDRAPINLANISMKMIGAYIILQSLFMRGWLHLRYGQGMQRTADLSLTDNIYAEFLKHVLRDAKRYEEAGIELDKFTTLKTRING